MVDRVIQVEVAARPDNPGSWVGFYPLLGEMRRTLFAPLERHRRGAK